MFYLMFFKKKIFNHFFDYKFFKRLCDFILACFLIILFIPIFILIAFLIKASSRGPIFFVQRRIGKNKKEFSCYKFRTMHPEADFMLKEILNTNWDIKKEFESNQKILNDPRITLLGKYLRYTSLDEIPQIINVLKGEMSFIGPRPLLEEYLPLYSKEQFMRHLVRPGLSGWAQINGRNNISWDQKFKLDLWYVKNISFALDLKIFFSTFFYIFKQSKVNQKDDLSMPQFKG